MFQSPRRKEEKIWWRTIATCQDLGRQLELDRERYLIISLTFQFSEPRGFGVLGSPVFADIARVRIVVARLGIWAQKFAFLGQDPIWFRNLGSSVAESQLWSSMKIFMVSSELRLMPLPNAMEKICRLETSEMFLEEELEEGIKRVDTF